MHLLAALTLALTAADNWTTWVCLREPVPGHLVTELNPVAAWLFGAVGLLPGLLVDLLASAGAVAFLLGTDRLPARARGACLAVISLSTALGVANNLAAITELGLW